jgi:hypothetical protein
LQLKIKKKTEGVVGDHALRVSKDCVKEIPFVAKLFIYIRLTSMSGEDFMNLLYHQRVCLFIA